MKQEKKELYEFGEIQGKSELLPISIVDKVKIFKDNKDKLYYFKYESNWFTEILAGKIAEFYGIPVVKHKKAYFEGQVGVISENFQKEECNYIDGETLIKEYFNSYPEIADEYDSIDKANNLETIWWALEHRYANRPNKDKLIEKLMAQFVLLYEYSMITAQSDFHLNNYQIEESNTDVNVAPLFDNAMSFLSTPSSALSLEKEDNCVNSYESIKKYYSYATNEQRESFITMLNDLSVEKLNIMIEEIINGVHLTQKEMEDIKSETPQIIKLFLMNKRKILSLNKEYISNMSK